MPIKAEKTFYSFFEIKEKQSGKLGHFRREITLFSWTYVIPLFSL